MIGDGGRQGCQDPFPPSVPGVPMHAPPACSSMARTAEPPVNSDRDPALVAQGVNNVAME